jgi:hypothetical protein
MTTKAGMVWCPLQRDSQLQILWSQQKLKQPSIEAARLATPKDMMYQDVSHMDIDGYYCLIFFDILQDAVSF